MAWAEEELVAGYQIEYSAGNTGPSPKSVASFIPWISSVIASILQSVVAFVTLCLYPDTEMKKCEGNMEDWW